MNHLQRTMDERTRGSLSTSVAERLALGIQHFAGGESRTNGEMGQGERSQFWRVLAGS